MEKDAAAPEQSSMTSSSPSAWKAVAVVLAAILAAVMICLLVLSSGLMKLGLSLL
jgi:hypothetical protein